MAAPDVAKKILIADDDAALRALLVAAFRRRGYAVSDVRDGTQLLARLEDAYGRDDMPHLVITDVHMPGLGGLDVIEMLGSRMASVPVILITAYVDRAIRQRARASGAATVLGKPFDLAELGRWVSRLLSAPSPDPDTGSKSKDLT